LSGPEQLGSAIAGARDTTGALDAAVQALGVSKGTKGSTSTNQASGVSATVLALSKGMKATMDLVAPQHVDKEIATLAQKIQDHHDRAVRYDRAAKPNPEAAAAEARRAVAALKKLMPLVDAKGKLMGEQGQTLVTSAEDAAKVSADAKVQAELLKSGPQKGGQLLDDPGESPDGGIVRKAAADESEPADAIVVEAPGEQPATSQQQAESRSDGGPSAVTAAPVGVMGAGSTASDIGVSLSADTDSAIGSAGATDTLVSDSARSDSTAGSGPGSYADVGVSDFDSGFFGSFDV
jgi:hypothetical protein